MFVCPKCGRQLNDSVKFCTACGTPVAQTPFNPAPVNQPPVNQTPVFHAPVNQPPMQQAPVYRPAADQAPVYRAPANTAPYGAPAPKKKFPKKVFLFGAIGLAVIAAAVVTLLLLLGGDSKSEGKSSYALYGKDREIYFSDLKHEPWQLTSRLDDGANIDDEELFEMGDGYAYAACMSDDGRYIFFIDKISRESSGLYYKRTSAREGEAVKVDSDVSAYSVDNSVKKVTYLKNDALYQYDIGSDSKEKIAADAGYGFMVSEDGRKIVYGTEDHEVYLYADGEKEKLASDADIQYIDGDFTTIYYTKDDSLYKQEMNGGEKEKIAADVDSVLTVYDSGEIYFVKDDGTEYDDFDDEYDPSKTGYSLYYYDGKEATELTDTLDEWSYNYAYDAPVIAYAAYDGTELERFIAVKGSATLLPQEKQGGYFGLNDAGTVAYYIDDISDDEDKGTLYRVEITEEKIGKPEVYDEDVYTGRCGFINDDEFYYYKDYKDGKGELYINKNKVDDDVRGCIMTEPFDLGKIFYFTDWDNGKGTLKVYDGEKAVKIEDDVSDYTVLPNGQVLYLYDYSTRSYTGTLYLWDGGDAIKLDDDATCLLPYVDSATCFVNLN